MGHLSGLISDLELILITGAITTILFRRIKQPLVLGYIIAGFLVGPHTSITPTVVDTENVKKRVTELFHGKLEFWFLGNLNARENTKNAPSSEDHLKGELSSQRGLDPWDVHLVDRILRQLSKKVMCAMDSR